MKTTLEALQNTLKTLREMTPAEYGEMDNDAWQLTQDIADCCSAICGRVDALDRLAPIPNRVTCDGQQHDPPSGLACQDVAAMVQSVAPTASDVWETGPATADRI